MKSKDVEIGKIYLVKVGNKLAPVRLDRESSSGKGWEGNNLDTGRRVYIRSAQRLLGLYSEVLYRNGQIRFMISSNK